MLKEALKSPLPIVIIIVCLSFAIENFSELLSYIESGRVKYQDNRDIGCLVQKCGFLGKFYYPCREDAQMDCAPY